MEKVAGCHAKKTKVDIMITSSKLQGDKMTKQRKHLEAARVSAHAAVRRKGEITRDAVYHELRIADQPLVASEIRVLLARQGMDFDPTYIRTILQGFVAEGTASTRQESADERLIRNGGRTTRGSHQSAMYFWAPAGKVPYRTKASTAKPIKARKAKSKKTIRPARAVPMQTGRPAISLKQQPHVPLLERVARLEKQLADIQALLG
jgi:hypothetical protein